MASATPDLRLPSQAQDIATGTTLYCLVSEAHVYEQLAQGRYLTAARPGDELATSRVASQRLNHHTTRRHSRSYTYLESTSVLNDMVKRPFGSTFSTFSDRFQTGNATAVGTGGKIAGADWLELSSAAPSKRPRELVVNSARRLGQLERR